MAASPKKSAATTAATAATARATRISNSNAGQAGTKKKAGRPAANKAAKKTADHGAPVKRRRGKMSVASKIKKEREARERSKAKKASIDEYDGVKLLKGAPRPEKVFNTKLGTEALEYEVECILGSRMDSKGKRDYKVKWVGWPTSHNSWEPEINLSNAFDLITDFDLSNPDAP